MINVNYQDNTITMEMTTFFKGQEINEVYRQLMSKYQLLETRED